MPAIIALTTNETHHQRGAGPSITPEMRSVIQLKFRLFRTSGTRESLCSIEGEASPWSTSGAVVAPFMSSLRASSICHPEPRRRRRISQPLSRQAQWEKRERGKSGEILRQAHDDSFVFSSRCSRFLGRVECAFIVIL